MCGPRGRHHKMQPRRQLLVCNIIADWQRIEIVVSARFSLPLWTIPASSISGLTYLLTCSDIKQLLAEGTDRADKGERGTDEEWGLMIGITKERVTLNSEGNIDGAMVQNLSLISQ